ncbi:MAG: HEAT repeat domain-containing protein, partial [Gemmataceae bacterium]|nr:HEAT repeat domain-containing protein [Gemmataceae bacterium]
GICEALEKEPEAEIRREAALLLGRMGTDAKEAVPYLAEALKKDPADIVREAAALALGDKLSSQAYDHVLVLAGALTDRHAGTRAAAAAALTAFGDKARLALPQLISVAKDKKADRLPRLYAIQIVSRLRSDQPETAGLLLAVAREAEAPLSVRVAAVEGVGRVEKPAQSDLPLLGELFHDKEVEVRRAAALVVAKLGEQAATLWPQVHARLKDDDNAVRFQLLRAAGAMARDHKEAIDALIKAALQDAHVENRLTAIGELGQLGPLAVAAADALAGLARQDARAAIREAAAAALKRIQP